MQMAKLHMKNDNFSKRIQQKLIFKILLKVLSFSTNYLNDIF